MSDADTGRTSDPTAQHDDEGFAPIEDLPLPGVHHEQGAAATRDDRGADLRDAGVARTAGERDGAAAGAGAASGSGAAATGAGTADGEYSDAPEVAQWSAADDGRDEGSTRAAAGGSRDAAVAEAYDAGPSGEIGGSESAAPVYEKSDPADLDDPGHVFDQTNGMVDALDGDSDGLAGGDEHSAAER